MIFRYDRQANPRLKIMKLILTILAVGILLVGWFAPAMVAIPVFVVAAILLFKVWGVYYRLIHSYINVHDEGVSGKTPNGRLVQMAYGSVTEAGVAEDQQGRQIVYLYNAGDDRLIQIPDGYRNFGALIDELGENCKLQQRKLAPGQDLEAVLKHDYPDVGGQSV